MYLSQLVDALATSLPSSRGRIDSLALRLQSGGILPKSEGGSHRPVVTIDDAVSLLFAHIVGVHYGHVAKAVADIRAYKNSTHGAAADCVARMLRLLVDLDTGEGGKGVYHSSIVIANGSRPALIVRIGNDDGEPVEIQFTPDGQPWHPNKADRIFETCVIPGRTLFAIAMALHPLIHPPVEHRVVPFKLHSVDGRPMAEWRAGIDAELARMPVNQ